ncbi:hypothetical protein ACSBR2_037508 [Camellia fascicularis]
MGAADMPIYPLCPKSTPSDLLTRGSAISSVSINLAEHHLTQLPALLYWELGSRAVPSRLSTARMCSSLKYSNS